jgi:hypothetical protein
MAITHMTITKFSDDNFDFYYHKPIGDTSNDVNEQRVEIVRFVDQAVDVILRCLNKMTIFPSLNDVVGERVLFECGKDLKPVEK